MSGGTMISSVHTCGPSTPAPNDGSSTGEAAASTTGDAGGVGDCAQTASNASNASIATISLVTGRRGAASTDRTESTSIVPASSVGLDPDSGPKCVASMRSGATSAE